MPTAGRESLASRNLGRLGIAIAIAVEMIAAFVACSSSSTPHPPALGGCKDRNGIPCTTGLSGGGGGGSRQDDGGPADAGGSTLTGDSGECVGANRIFSATTAACLACLAANCCLNPTSCPNDPSCTAVGACVAQCLPTDPACVQTCEAPASIGTITAFDDFASCSESACPGCPTLQTSAGGG